MFKKTIAATLAAAALFAATTKTAHAAEVPITSANVPLAAGFSFFYSLHHETTNGQVVFRCGIKFLGYGLTTNTIRLSGTGRTVAVNLDKTGQSGLELHATLYIVRNGKEVSWQLVGSVRNRYAPWVRTITFDKRGSTRLP